MNRPSTRFQLLQAAGIACIAGISSLSVFDGFATMRSPINTTGSSNQETSRRLPVVQVECTRNNTDEEQNSQEQGVDYHYSPRNMTGSWLGNTWIPPSPWKLHSVDEIRSIFHGLRVLWIGDSLSRRSSMSLFSILNQTTTRTTTPTTDQQQQRPPTNVQPKVHHVSVESLERYISLNRGSNRESCTRRWSNQTSEHRKHATPWVQFPICRHVYNYSPRRRGDGAEEDGLVVVGDVTFFPTPKLKDIRTFLKADLASKHPIVAHYDVVVVAMGAWETTLWPQGKRKRAVQDINLLFQQLILRHSNTFKAVIWRTAGWPAAIEDKFLKGIDDLNVAIMDTVDSLQKSAGNHSAKNLRSDANSILNETKANASHSFWEAAQKISYVDWASAVSLRSFGSDRIAGDSNAHYGLDARLALIQMIANHLRITLMKETHE